MCGPRPAEDDVVAPVKEVGRVQRVEARGLEAGLGAQGRARPLPDAAEVGLAGEAGAVGGDGGGVPVTEADVAGVEVGEEGVLDGGGRALGLVVVEGEGGRGWRGLLDAVVDEVAARELVSQ